MIDFSKITISEEKLGSNYQLKGGIVVTNTRNCSEREKENTKLKIKREIWKKLYGEIYNPVQELKSLVNEYLLEPAQSDTYQYHPCFLNSKKTQELIDKIDKMLKMPE